MLRRISTFVGALMMVGLFGHADAAPPKAKKTASAEAEAPKDTPDPWRSNVKRRAEPQVRMTPTRVNRPVTTVLVSKEKFDVGRLEGIGDGVVLYSVPLSEVQRNAIATRTKQSLSTIAKRERRMIRISDYAMLSVIKNRMGKTVELHYKTDAAGFAFLTDIRNPKP